MAQKRSDVMLFTGLTMMERLLIKPTTLAMQPGFKFSFRQLSERPKSTKSG